MELAPNLNSSGSAVNARPEKEGPGIRSFNNTRYTDRHYTAR